MKRQGHAQFDLKQGLRVLGGFVVIFISVWIVTLMLGVGPNMLLRMLGADDQLRVLIGGSLGRPGVLAATLILSAWMLRRVTGLNGWSVMFPTQKGWYRDLVVGLALAAAAMLLLFVIESGAGWLAVMGWQIQAQPFGVWLQAVWLALLANTLAAVGEEALFRGYLLTGLVRAWGKGAALAVMAVLFALSHIAVTGASETHWLLFTVMLALPGLMLGWVYLRTGNLWLPVGIHLAWNLFQDDVLNLTGERAGVNLFGLLTEQRGPAWFVGTTYGIEVGVAGVLALVVVVAGVLLWTGQWRRPGHTQLPI
jgi:uncharacterized protein